MSEREGTLPQEESVMSPERPKPHFDILADREFRQVLWDRVNRLVDGVKRQRFGSPTLLFLDKSARPLAWLFRARWKKRSKDQPVPGIRFAAVGRRQNLEQTDDFIQLHQDLSDVLVVEENPYGDERFRKIYGKPMMLRAARSPQTDYVKGKFLEEIRGHGASGEYAARVKELAERYADLKAQRVIVVDDYSDTGASKLLTQLMLSDALPHADIESIHLFSEEEMHKIPWLQRQGLVGVVELAESDELLASPLNRETFEKLKAEYADRIRTYEEEDLAHEREFFSKRLETLLEQLVGKSGGLYDVIRDKASVLKRQLLEAERYATGSERAKRFRAVYVGSMDLFNDVMKLRDQDPTFQYIAAPTLFASPDYERATETLESFTSFEDVREKSDALRQEIAALGNMEREEL